MAETRPLRRGFAATTTTQLPDEVWRRWTDPTTWGSWDQWACQAKLAPGRRSKAAPARGAGVGGWQLGPGLVRGG